VNVGELERALADAGVELFLDDARLRYRAPKGALSEALRAAIGEHRGALVQALAARASAGIARDDDRRHEPFPLTDLQQAYWVGEQGLFEAAGAGYFYQEYRVDDLDVARLRRAVAELSARHDVLRLVVEDGGAQQRFAPPGPPPPVPCIEHGDRGGAQAEATMVELRARLAERLPSLSDGQPISFSVVRFADQVRIGILIRLIAADGVSLETLYGDLVALYTGAALEDRADVPSYRDYVLSRVAHTGSAAYRRSLDYWTARLDTLPGPPQLPVATGDARGLVPPGAGLRRRHGALDAERWRRLQDRARRAGLPVNSLLCSLFVDCVRRWSSEDRFTLNVLVANRPPADPQVDRIVGNCSSTTLLEIAPVAAGASVIERARTLQGQLYADLQHADVPGVAVIRELARRRPPDGRPPMPVVFTSGIGLTRDFRGFTLGADGWRLVHSALRTPQVWLDHQVYEEDGALLYNWDFEPQALDPGAIDAMFACYEALLAELVDDEAAWHDPEVPRLPADEVRERDAANATGAAVPAGNLISALLDRVERPDGDAGVAVVDPDRRLRYGELLTEASVVAGGLRRLGCQPGDLIAIHLEHGWRQAVAVLGVHLAGAAYVPVDGAVPPARLEQIVRHAGARALIARGSAGKAAATAAGVASFDIDADRDADALGYGIAPRPSAADELAYVIYTSGSTGAPKGVAMEHGAALNTLVDVRARFGLDPSDRVLAISSLAFDLSVFDLFATFAAGATLVYPRPSARPDPQALADAVRDQRVTVWSSVPALLELTCEYLGDRVATELASLRLIMLSGDWIPLALAALVRERLPGARLVSLGGATEAAVWSNYHEVHGLDPAWPSIPYGRPLANQRLQVLDRQLRPVPRGVVGDLYISGLGLARGYHNARDLTRASFLAHPRTGERLYRTGDLARYREAGLIEFLGRSDAQVKIGGFRIELGEIETHLRRVPGVEAAVVLATTAATRGAARKLAGFVVEDGTARFDAERARGALAERLPHYMLPTRLEIVARIPLTANGKVDRRRLEASLAAPAAGAAPSRARTVTEARLAAIWAALLGIDDVAPEAEFFALGGDSLRAVRLFHRIQRDFGLRLPLDSLFEHGTVAAQSRLIDERVAMSTQAWIRLRAGEAGRTPLFLFPPVGGAIFCYRPLLEAIGPHTPIHGVRAWGLEPGEQPLESVPAMCDRYLPRLREAAPAGRAVFAGWSMGGVVALYAARAFEAAGGDVDRVLAIDSWVGDELAPPSDEARDFREFVADLGSTAVQGLASSGGGDDLASPATLSEPLRRAFAVFRANARALRACPALTPGPDSFPVTYIEAAGSSSLHRWVRPFEHRRWTAEAQRWQRVRVDADHYTVMASDGVRQYADSLRETSAE
jgi:mycobactin phenyloxazoline synthetase